LCVLRLRLVDAWLVRPVVLPVARIDQPARCGDRFARHGNAIGAHVGNEAHRFAEDIDTLIKALRNAHRATGAEAELARCLLLQGRGSEGSGRVAARLLLLDGRDNVARVAQDALCRGARGRLASQIELVEALTIEMGKAGREALAARGSELDFDGP